MIDIAGFTITRLGVVMSPEAENPNEAWGVLNPACARDRDGDLFLFPRIVAEGNYSRIGRCRVLFDEEGVPSGVERLGMALEPEEAWERNPRTAGVEDPRITYIAALDSYVMTYSAYGPLASRIGLAISTDLEKWERLGPAWFSYDHELKTDLNLYTNKDAAFFPEPVMAPDGRECLAMLHRPVWDLSVIVTGGHEELPAGIAEPRPGIWVSFVPLDEVKGEQSWLTHLSQHRVIATPEQEWESLKIGAGTPPVKIEGSWLILHHGVDGAIMPGSDHQQRVRYSAGAMVLDGSDITRVLARSTSPLLKPEVGEELEGIVPNVVFPTAIDMSDDDNAFVFYGMADSNIGVCRMTFR